MEIYGYLVNGKTDATISGSLHSPVKVEIAAYRNNGFEGADWFVLETRHFDTIAAATSWAERALS